MIPLPRFGAAIAALVFALAVLMVCLGADWYPAYPDFITGEITLWDKGKTGDILGPLAAAAVAAIVFAVTNRMIRRVESRHGMVEVTLWDAQIILWSIPALAAMAGGLFNNELPAAPVWLSVACLAGILAALGRRARADGLEPAEVGRMHFVILLFALAPMFVALATGRLRAGKIGTHEVEVLSSAMGWILWIGVASGTAMAMLKPAAVRACLPWLSGVAQLALPLGFMCLLPVRMDGPAGVDWTYPVAKWLGLLVVVAVVAGFLDVLRRLPWRRGHAKPEGGSPWLSPVAISAAVVVLIAGIPAMPVVSSDDYHYGEKLVGWWSSVHHGAIPYVDYFPAKGIVDDDLGGYVAYFGFDGTAGVLPEAGRWTAAGLAVIAFGAMRVATGSTLLAFVASVFLGIRPAWYFMVPFLCCWTSPALRANPKVWMASWCVGVPILVIGVPGQGLVLAVASSLLAAEAIWQWYRKPEVGSSWVLVGALALAGVLALATPLGKMFFGAIGYVWENGSINQIAWGRQWAPAGQPGEPTGTVYDLARMSWVAVVFVCIPLLVAYKRAETRATAYTAAMILAFSILLAPYVMGRLDVGDPSRPGAFSVLVWCALIPLLCWPRLQHGGRARLLAGMTVASSTMMPLPMHTGQPASVANSRISLASVADGASLGLPNLGRAIVEDEHLSHLLNLKKIVDARIGDDETYLDLTSRGAHYFYLGRRLPLELPAPYNIVSPARQRAMVERLAKTPPKLVLIEAANFLPSGGYLAWRAPLLHRFVVKNYKPVKAGDFLLGVPLAGPLGDDSPAARMSDAGLLDAAMATDNLRSVPAAWGRSINSLRERMARMANLEAVEWNTRALQPGNAGDFLVTGDSPWVDFSTGGVELSGWDAGILCFRLNRQSKSKDALRVSLAWWGDGQSGPVNGAGLVFRATQGGDFVIPLDTMARWLFIRRIDRVRISLPKAKLGDRITIKDASLFQRKAHGTAGVNMDAASD